jgi:hypothetical protein
MKRVCVICEGQTEETFVRDVLAPSLYALNLNLVAETIETSPGHKGGALNYDRVKRHLKNTLSQRSRPVVTTFFDLYRLDKRFPGFESAQAFTDYEKRIDQLHAALHQDVIQAVACEPSRFIPYIQAHEFEALLFSDVHALTQVEAAWNKATPILQSIRTQVSTPEQINHRPETKPAAHLERALQYPRFKKAMHGPIAAKRIGLAKIESECPGFSAWLNTLRALAHS